MPKLAINGWKRNANNPIDSEPMKKCSHCGLENPDDAVVCSTCHTGFVTEKPAPAAPLAELPDEYVISPLEQSFWQRMTFRQFAVLFVRLQALWFFFDAAVEATYLPNYILEFNQISSYSHASPSLRLNSSLLVLRIGLHVVAGFALIFNAEKLLSWLVKDSVQRQKT
jgi:hypothetical protein